MNGFLKPKINPTVWTKDHITAALQLWTKLFLNIKTKMMDWQQRGDHC